MCVQGGRHVCAGAAPRVCRGDRHVCAGVAACVDHGADAEGAPVDATVPAMPSPNLTLMISSALPAPRVMPLHIQNTRTHTWITGPLLYAGRYITGRAHVHLRYTCVVVLLCRSCTQLQCTSGTRRGISERTHLSSCLRSKTRNRVTFSQLSNSSTT